MLLLTDVDFGKVYKSTHNPDLWFSFSRDETQGYLRGNCKVENCGYNGSCFTCDVSVVNALTGTQHIVRAERFSNNAGWSVQNISLVSEKDCKKHLERTEKEIARLEESVKQIKVLNNICDRIRNIME